ncbi:MAG: nuclear transport factor 2 family protein [Candidatus Niyogibacteria bacterium]|nr:nuclear transport factor 2 family protein [Candidatus Niyogibacteria bacterium]
MKKKYSKNIRVVLDILRDEVNGDVASALKKMTSDYTMTWVDAGINGKELFPTTSNNIKKELEEAYPIKGRQYDIKNITEGDNVVMVELIESFPNTKTKKVYRTPLVLVLEMRDGKIRTGRHYLDPRLSGKHLTKAQIAKAYKNSKGLELVIE